MSFAAVAWLWSGLALALPILIHLLGHGRGVRRLWPSVRLLRETGLSSGARWRPSEPWLLFWRCSLLGAVALALAEPLIQPGRRAGVLWLVEPGVAADGTGAAGAGFAGSPAGGRGSAGNAGNARNVGKKGKKGSSPGSNIGEVRYLAPRLPTSAPVAGDVPDLWSLLAEADALFPPGLTFKVVARPRLAALRGTRPSLGHQIDWVAPRLRASAPVEARRAPAAPPASLAPGARPEPPAVGPIRLRLLVDAAPERAADAVALRAGLARGARALGWTIEEAAGATGAVGADLLASLGREPPADWVARVERGATLLRDAAGELHACASQVATRCCGGFTRWQCGGEAPGEALWRDGAGRSALARSPRGAGAILRFAGRFAPAAADWSGGVFAALLRDSFGAPLAADAETSIAQALPRRRPAAGSPAAAGESFAGLAWALAGGCFAVERWLALRLAARRRG
ncbi:MAG TPA: BatA domain-containing protein [Thermoanaerobaculia bacterium]|nr:BatA domain-containing protein [Thermoanaerobaculia bacterium]